MAYKRILNTFFLPLKYIVKKLAFIIIFLGLFTLFSGCQTRYYPLMITKNTIGLQKVELAKTKIKSYEKQFFPTSYYDRSLWDKAIEAGEKIFKTKGYFQATKFCGKEYYIHEGNFFQGVYIIRKNDMKEITFLPTPRSIYAFSAFPITMSNKDYLVVYIEQRATSFSTRGLKHSGSEALGVCEALGV